MQKQKYTKMISWLLRYDFTLFKTKQCHFQNNTPTGVARNFQRGGGEAEYILVRIRFVRISFYKITAGYIGVGAGRVRYHVKRR